MPQVMVLESKKQSVPCSAGPIILVCAHGVCAVVEAEETHLTHSAPSVPQ